MLNRISNLFVALVITGAVLAMGCQTGSLLGTRTVDNQTPTPTSTPNIPAAYTSQTAYQPADSGYRGKPFRYRQAAADTKLRIWLTPLSVNAS